MAIPVGSHLDFQKHESQNMVTQNLAIAPSSPVEGQRYYNTVDNVEYFWDGTAWISAAGGITDVTGTAPIVSTPSGTTRVISITAATPSAAGSLSGADKTKLDASTSAATPSTLIERAASGRAKVADGVANDDIATVGQVNTAIGTATTSMFEYKGAIDNANTNPNYPAASAGDAYRIRTTSGRVGGASGKIVNVGDVLVANADNAGGSEAAVGLSWDVYESNRDQATETTLGVAQIATQAETDAGTNDTDIVTPLKLSAYIGNVTGVVRKSTGTVTGNGILSSFTIAHTFATRNVEVQVYQSASPFGTILVDINRTLATSVDIVFGTAPAIGENYTVVILG